ncbi:MAG: hypothetical protein HUJ76_07235 [Parasporobacterium sp.]|nr:hypothetical protein [Parasporobacterium sp.]
MDTAYLSSVGRYTIFSAGDVELKIIAPYSLERYERVVEWDNGYLVVMAKYSHNEKLEEEYIDLIPVLRNLLMDEEKFLNPIKKVEVRYA